MYTMYGYFKYKFQRDFILKNKNMHQLIKSVIWSLFYLWYLNCLGYKSNVIIQLLSQFCNPFADLIISRLLTFPRSIIL